jgi:hypothetical protein
MTAGFKLGTYSDKVPTSFRVPDENFYVMTLDDWDEPIRSAFQDKETGEFPMRVNLKFKIVADVSGDTEFEGEEVGKFVGIDLNPNVKDSIWHVLSALDPASEPEPGGAIETYRGKRLIGEVTHTIKPSKKNPGQTVTYANVGAVKPFKKPKKAAEAPARNPLLDDEDL